MTTPLGYGSPVVSELTHGEATTWHFIQRLSFLAQGVVEQEVRAAANLSVSEFEVLGCLVESGGGLRQVELAARLGWDKSRLSHQLTRMEHRELIERSKRGRIHSVTASRVGAQKLELAGSAHVAAVRALLLDHLSDEAREALIRTAELHADDGEPVPEAGAVKAVRPPRAQVARRLKTRLQPL